MKKAFEHFVMCLIVATTMLAGTCDAATAPRKTTATKTTTAANAAAAARVPTKSASRAPVTSAPKVTTTKTEPETEPVVPPEPEPVTETPIIVDNKTSMFQDVMSEIGASSTDASENALAEAIRRQRALLDGAATATTTTGGGSGNMSSAAACNAALRQCMTEKCGTGFTKCANDSTAVWGQKVESCRSKTKCTGHEYSLLAPEILADRDMNVRMAHYNSVINCGNKYNDCIFTQCGTTLNKCLAKKDGDNAVSKCASIANECKAMDNGLASRVMNVFGDLRKTATAQATRDEARLVELRKLMREQCNRFGAMFDERTLDCVYTVNFFAGEDNTLMASKKLYSGDAFQCNANWFGIDITTFKENAYRLTRSQKSASAAALGAGVGTAAGMLSSGAIGRAIDTAKARKAEKDAEKEKECAEMGSEYEWDGSKCVKKSDDSNSHDRPSAQQEGDKTEQHVDKNEGGAT